MNAYIRIILLAAALVSFTCIGLLSFAQKVPNAKLSSPTDSDLPLFLNGEPIGSMANTSNLESRLASLPGGAKSNVNGADGLPHIGNMVFVPDDRLSMSGLADLWDKIDDNFDYPRYNSMALWAGNPCDGGSTGPTSSHRSAFVLSNSKLSVEELRKLRESEGCWIRTEVLWVKPPSTYSARLLKSYRTAVTSLEITNSGSYFLNEQVPNEKLRASPIANLGNPALRRRVDAAQIKQRSIDPNSLEKEVEAWVKLRDAEGPIGMSSEDDPAAELPLIVSGQVSFETLAPVLKVLAGKRNPMTIVVNSIPAGVVAKPK